MPTPEVLNQGRFQVIVSPFSRSGASKMEELQALLEDHGDVKSFKDFDDLERLLLQQVEAKKPVVWVGGGDGTIRFAAQVLKHQEIALGILPLGTGNSLARDLNIPLSLDKAVEALLHSQEVEHIDLGLFGDEVFVNVATLGASTQIAKGLRKKEKRYLGILSYIPALRRGLPHLESVRVSLHSPDYSYTGRVVQLVVASGQNHMGVIKVTQKADITDGKLSVYLVRDEGKKSLMRYARALGIRRQELAGNVDSFETDCIDLRLPKPQPFVIDGETRMTDQVAIRILPGALRVLLPYDPQHDDPARSEV